MENVVPSALRRLREVDIVSMAGLKSAALGQEYYCTGAVHTTTRQGPQLTGIVEVPETVPEKAALPTNTVEETEQLKVKAGRYPVQVEIRGRSTWSTSCTCAIPSNHLGICPHAAALLYQWIALPMTFTSPSAITPISTPIEPVNQNVGAKEPGRLLPLKNATGENVGAKESGRLLPLADTSPTQGAPSRAALSAPIALGNIAEMLAQIGLSELRTIAREYDITKSGLNKQQLVEAMLEALRQPAVVRRVVGTLAKPERQLLAALTLADGVVSDEDLRGLYERFSLGYPNQLQSMLTTLRSKCLLFPINGSLGGRIGLIGSLLEVGWYVPSEVRASLHVTVPITPFTIQTSNADNLEVPKIQQVEPYSLLEDLLLVARALDGYQLGDEDTLATATPTLGNTSVGAGLPSALLTDHRRPMRSPLSISTDGLLTVPPPLGMPSSTLLQSLQSVVPRTPTFLRFAIRLLRLVDILYKDDAGTPYLRILPNAARLLLSPTRIEIVHDLFTRWLTQATYDELFDLQEEGLHLCCRSTSLDRSALRTGELETRNSQARQMLVALLAKVPLNQWVSFSAFARFVYRLNPTFLQKQHILFSSPPWWIEQEDRRQLHPTQLPDWLRAEGRYLARLLCGPLHWWGLSDLTLSDDGQLLAFRLTPLAGLLWHGNQPSANNHKSNQSAEAVPSTPARETILNVSETNDLLISCTSVAWPLIELIEDFAEIAGVQSGRLRYQLTSQSLSAALSRGLHPTTLLQLLHQHAEPDERLGRMLGQLEHRLANYGRTRLYTNVTLLQAADTPVIRELSATLPLENLLVRTIHPTVLILKEQGAERIIQDLKRRGQTPLLHEEESYGAE